MSREDLMTRSPGERVLWMDTVLFLRSRYFDFHEETLVLVQIGKEELVMRTNFSWLLENHVLPELEKQLDLGRG